MSPARAGSSASRACSAWTPCIGRVGAAASSPSSVDSTRRSAPSPAGSSSPMRGHTTYAWRPPRTSSPTRAQVRSIQPGRSSGTTWVVIGARPAGSSRSVEVSRSPKTVMATVRGMGVAVMTSTCGGSFPLPRNASRCSTPNRCCSSTTTRARSRKSTWASRRAWVPTTIPASPTATSSSALRRSAVDWLPVRRTTRVASAAPPSIPPSARSPSIRVIVRWCCEARTSVGASSAAWPPESTAASIARSATIVLPEPTSPWSSRCIGTSRAISAATVSPTSTCPAVSSKGSRASNASRTPPGRPGRGVVTCPSATRRRCASVTWRTNASS